MRIIFIFINIDGCLERPAVLLHVEIFLHKFAIYIPVSGAGEINSKLCISHLNFKF